MDKNEKTVVVFDASVNKWLKFSNPLTIIKTDNINEVLSCLIDVENQVKENKLYAVGFISYEASPAFDSALVVKKEKIFMPLLWFALFNECSEIELPEVKKTENYFINWNVSASRDEYDKCIAAVKHNIYEGNTYQVNYTIRQYSKFIGNPFELFCSLSNAQRARYSVFINTENFAVCSASPELFFTYDGKIITSKPMKGTAKRKFILEEDEYQAEWLHNSIKNRAENVMILDMIRNDIGRIAVPGSVNVTEKFKVEKYPTVWQMISTVEAKTSKSIVDIFKALFPCASITGAPKPYTMKIISEVESTPRGIYTGTVGFIKPDNKCQFNVAIRTVIINKRNNTAEFGVGGGIVWDSTDKDEYEECKIKTKFLNEKYKEFCLLESILWTKKEGYFLLDYHLRRLKRAALYFNYPISVEEVCNELEKIETEFDGLRYKIRVLVDSKGLIKCEHNSLSGDCEINNQITKIAVEPININTPFVYYKTTNRLEYDKFKQKYPGFYDVILWNEKGEITETTIGNLVVEMNEKLFTPPVKCGLLAGTYREYLLTTCKIKEKIIKLEDLKTAENVYMINSIRKWIKLKIAE